MGVDIGSSSSRIFFLFCFFFLSFVEGCGNVENGLDLAVADWVEWGFRRTPPATNMELQAV